MPTLDVLDLNKKKVGSVQLNDAVFGAEPHRYLVHAAVVMQQACERQGTASTLRRGEVSGSGRKPWKQKHTGRARAGSVRSPVWRHGGTVFGPKPRSYAYRIRKQQYRTAMQSALSARVADGSLVVVSDLSIPQPKTRLLARALVELGLTSLAMDDALETCDVAVIVPAHPGLDPQEVVERAPLVVDFRGVTSGVGAAKVVRL